MVQRIDNILGAPWLRTKECFPKVEKISACLRTKDSLPKN